VNSLSVLNGVRARIGKLRIMVGLEGYVVSLTGLSVMHAIEGRAGCL